MKVATIFVSSVFLSACASAQPYYSTLTVDKTAVSSSTQPSTEIDARSIAVNEGPPYEIDGTGLMGVVVITKRHTGSEDKNAMLARAQAKVAALGGEKIVAASYSKRDVDGNERFVGLIKGPISSPGTTGRKSYVVCFASIETGETDVEARKTDLEKYGDLMRRHLLMRGYYPVVAQEQDTNRSKSVEDMRKACPSFAGSFLTGDVALSGGVQIVISSTRESVVELRLTDLESGKVGWKVDGRSQRTSSFGGALWGDRFLFRTIRMEAINKAFLQFPVHDGVEGPAEK